MLVTAPAGAGPAGPAQTRAREVRGTTAPARWIPTQRWT